MCVGEGNSRAELSPFRNRLVLDLNFIGAKIRYIITLTE